VAAKEEIRDPTPAQARVKGKGETICCLAYRIIAVPEKPLGCLNVVSAVGLLHVACVRITCNNEPVEDFAGAERIDRTAMGAVLKPEN
jgi:hypothetical protein